MALDLHRILAGLEIESADISTQARLLVGSGAPGGDSGYQDAANKGSIYMRTGVAANNLQVYFKVGTANVAADWVQLADTAYVQAVVNGLSWREPAIVLDATSYANSAAFPTGGTVDGVALSASDRVLFTNVTAGVYENVWVWTPGVSGAVTGVVTTGLGGSFQIAGDYTATFVAGTVFSVAGSTGNDGNFTVASSSFGSGLTTIVVVETIADSTADGTITALWVEDTNAETDGDALLIQQGTSADQQWVYDGTNWVLIAAATSGAELGFIRTFIGKNAAGSEMPNYTSTFVVTQNGSLEAAIGELDAAFGDGEITNDGGNWSLSDDLLWGTAGTLTITGAFNSVNAAIGDRSYTENNYVTDGQSVAASIEALDVQAGAIADQMLVTSATNVNATGTVTVDSIPTANATEIKWLIQVRANGTPANRRALELHVLSDGSNVDHNQYSILKLGANISGFSVTVDISGGNIRLRLTATPAVDYVVKRLGYSSF